MWLFTLCVDLSACVWARKAARCSHVEAHALHRETKMLACRIVAIVAIALVGSPVAHAQVNDQQLPCEAFSQSAAVFVGVAGTPVVQVVDLSDQPPFTLKVTPMQVERAYLGATDATILVTALSIDEPFTPGGKYLVYGREYSAPGIVMASPGIGAKDVDKAANDLAFLEALPQGLAGGNHRWHCSREGAHIRRR